jgi:CheY-like chemotaxis protein
MTHTRTPGAVLLVSEDADWRYILGTMLRHAGMNVGEVDHPDQIQEHARDAALVVTNYPVRMSDGRTVTEFIRTTPATAHVPILNVTTRVLPEELDAAEDAGVTRSLLLPATMQELVDAVAEMLQPRGGPPTGRDTPIGP